MDVLHKSKKWPDNLKRHEFVCPCIVGIWKPAASNLVLEQPTAESQGEWMTINHEEFGRFANQCCFRPVRQRLGSCRQRVLSGIFSLSGCKEHISKLVGDILRYTCSCERLTAISRQKLSRVVAKAWSISVLSEFSMRKLKTVFQGFSERFEQFCCCYHIISYRITPFLGQYYGLYSSSGFWPGIAWTQFFKHLSSICQSLRKSEHILPSMQGKRWFPVVLSDFRLFPNHARIRSGSEPRPLPKH